MRRGDREGKEEREGRERRERGERERGEKREAKVEAAFFFLKPGRGRI